MVILGTLEYLGHRALTREYDGQLYQKPWKVKSRFLHSCSHPYVKFSAVDFFVSECTNNIRIFSDRLLESMTKVFSQDLQYINNSIPKM